MRARTQAHGLYIQCCIFTPGQELGWDGILERASAMASLSSRHAFCREIVPFDGVDDNKAIRNGKGGFAVHIPACSR